MVEMILGSERKRVDRWMVIIISKVQFQTDPLWAFQKVLCSSWSHTFKHDINDFCLNITNRENREVYSRQNQKLLLQFDHKNK